MSERTKSVLVVEDSKPMRMRLKQICGELHFKTFEAGDGHEALRVLNEVPVDLILTDCNMPNMDGHQLIDVLKKLPNFSNIPVIMITTESEKAKILEALMGGAKDYVVKPFNDATLKQKICLALGLPIKK